MRETALELGSSRRRETGPSKVVDDKTTAKFLVRACAVTFPLLPFVVFRSSSWLLKLPIPSFERLLLPQLTKML